MSNISRADEMKKFNVWEEPVLCFVTTELTRRNGTKFLCISAFDDFDEGEGQGFYNIDGNERLVNTFPAPVGTKNLYGQCKGRNDGMDDAVYLGCEIPHGHQIDWMKAVVDLRKLYKVDSVTGARAE